MVCPKGLGVVRICFTKFLQRTKERINRVNPVSLQATRVREYLLNTDCKEGVETLHDEVSRADSSSH